MWWWWALQTGFRYPLSYLQRDLVSFRYPKLDLSQRHKGYIINTYSEISPPNSVYEFSQTEEGRGEGGLLFVVLVVGLKRTISIWLVDGFWFELLDLNKLIRSSIKPVNDAPRVNPWSKIHVLSDVYSIQINPSTSSNSHLNYPPPSAGYSWNPH